MVTAFVRKESAAWVAIASLTLGCGASRLDGARSRLGASEALPGSATTKGCGASSLPATGVDANLYAHAYCEGTCTEDPIPKFAQLNAANPVFAWSQELAPPGSTLNLIPRRGIHFYVLVLKGEATVSAFSGGVTQRLGPWGAVYTPEGGLRISGSEARFVVVASTDGDETLSHVIGREVPTAEAKEALRAEAPVYVTSFLRQNGECSSPNGEVRAAIGFEEVQDRNASFTLLRTGPTFAVPEHRHERSWEVLIALQGKGTARVGGLAEASGTKDVEVKDGSVVVIPKNVSHSWEPDGMPLVALQLYIPPGPEQKFRKLGEAGPAKP